MPPGRVISAVRPAPMRWWMTFPMTVVDTMFKALAPAIPDRVIAGHHADLCVAPVHGINPKDSKFFIGNLGPLGGGWGAKRSEDGISATVCINDGDTHNRPSEQVEAKFPLRDRALCPASRIPAALAFIAAGWAMERGDARAHRVTFGSQIDRAHLQALGPRWRPRGDRQRDRLRLDGKWKEDFPTPR